MEWRAVQALLLKWFSVIGACWGMLFHVGCDFAQPNGQPSGGVLERRLIGNWKSISTEPGKAPVIFGVREISASRYRVTLDDTLEWEAYAIDFPSGSVQVLELTLMKMAGQDLPNSKGVSRYQCVAYRLDADSLTVMRLTPKEGMKLNTTEEQRRYLQAMFAEDKFYGAELKFTRVTTADPVVSRVQLPPSSSQKERVNVTRALETKSAPATAKIIQVNPVALATPPPVYPAAMQANSMQGKVVVEFVISTVGEPTGLKVMESSHPEFDQPALDAIAQWRYQPARDKAGQAVAVLTRQTISFELRK